MTYMKRIIGRWCYLCHLISSWFQGSTCDTWGTRRFCCRIWKWQWLGCFRIGDHTVPYREAHSHQEITLGIVVFKGLGVIYNGLKTVHHTIWIVWGRRSSERKIFIKNVKSDLTFLLPQQIVKHEDLNFVQKLSLGLLEEKERDKLKDDTVVIGDQLVRQISTGASRDSWAAEGREGCRTWGFWAQSGVGRTWVQITPPSLANWVSLGDFLISLSFDFLIC